VQVLLHLHHATLPLQPQPHVPSLTTHFHHAVTVPGTPRTHQ
jgi:hypothetical protein